MPTAQNYIVVVEGAPNAPATVYDLVVTLSSGSLQTLNFVNGTATVQGLIAANQPQDYRYFGGAGQTVLISLMNQALGELTGAGFRVTGVKDGVVYKSFEDPPLSWFFTMPVSQDYRITIISPQAAVYTLEVALSPDSIQQDSPASGPQSTAQRATPTPAPLSQADALPAPGCTTTALQNGGFEADGAWSFGSSDIAMPVYVTTPVQADLRSLRLGLDPAFGSAVQKASSLSSVRQPIQIPADATVAQLRWSHFYRTDEEPSGAPGTDSDRQEVLLLNPDLSTVAVLQSVRRNDDAWVTDTFDLTPYTGQSLILAFNVYNDGNGRNTWQYLDEVSLAICTSNP